MQECPRCGARFSAHEDWAKVALTTLMLAPSVQDLATQVCCPRCHYLLTEVEVRYSRAWGYKGVLLILLIFGVSALGWMFS